MKTNALSPLSGVALALMAAGLAGCATSGARQADAPKAAGVEMVHCAGVNSCKGHNDCKTAANACAGHGACKGQGFVATPATACEWIGGHRVDPEVTWTVAASELIHCSGVNTCKGHNDCQTATNACKGQASCKGTGWVALPASTCANIGGTAG